MQILDCTIRDGGYINSWKFEKGLVREVYRALSKSGVDYIELGFRGTEKYFDPQIYGRWRFSTEEDLSEVTRNISGAKIALMGDYGKIELDDLILQKDSCVDLVRVAVNKNNIFNAIDLLEEIKGKGYKVSLQCMGYSTYTDNEKYDLLDALAKTDLDYVYVADSYGSMFPHQIKSFLEPFLNIGSIKVGFHAHNSLQMAFANSLEAIRAGCQMIDCTIYGMGRAAGNLPTEILISYLANLSPERYNAIPVLNIIDQYFLPIMIKNPWGYQLPFMLSGIFQCHPNYPKRLIDTKEFTIEDIWKALEYIKGKDPVGFKKEIVEEVINDGIIGYCNLYKNTVVKEHDCKISTNKLRSQYQRINREVPYINRHKDRDFLILANGPTLKQFRDQINEFIKKNDPIVMGANYLGGMVIPDYHAFNNKRRFKAYVDTVHEDSILFLGEYLTDDFINEYTNNPYDKFYYENVLNQDFNIIDGIIQTNCRTVSILLIAVSIVMGSKRIFVVGMDGHRLDGNVHIESTHFYDENDEKDEQELIIDRHRWSQKYLKQIDYYCQQKGLEGVHILTPTVYKSFYKGIKNYI